MDWELFWGATTAAATVATAVSTSVVLWLRRRERPWPGWLLTGRAKREGDGGDFTFVASLHNSGDGTVHNVQIDGVGLCVAWSPETPAPSQIMAPGASIVVRGRYPADHHQEARVLVTWYSRPVRLQRRWAQELWLSDFLEVENTMRRADFARRTRAKRWSLSKHRRFLMMSSVAQGRMSLAEAKATLRRRRIESFRRHLKK